MKPEPKPHLENLKTLRTRLKNEGYTRNLEKSLKTLRSDLLSIEFPNPLGICCFVGRSELLRNLARHILNLKTYNRAYWLLPLEEGKYVTPLYNGKENELVHPRTGISCMDYYHGHHDRLENNPDLPLQPLDLARQKLVEDVVELIDTLLGDQK